MYHFKKPLYSLEGELSVPCCKRKLITRGWFRFHLRKVLAVFANKPVNIFIHIFIYLIYLFILKWWHAVSDVTMFWNSKVMAVIH